MSVENTLAERGARYGAFEEHATIAQAIQNAYRVYPEKWNRLPPIVKQGFQVIADKIARTLNGDELYADNYHDIGGYAKLIEDWAIKQSTPVSLFEPEKDQPEFIFEDATVSDSPLFSESVAFRATQ